MLSPNLLNNLRLQFQLTPPITEFAPVIYSTQFVVPISSGGSFRADYGIYDSQIVDNSLLAVTAVVGEEDNL